MNGEALNEGAGGGDGAPVETSLRDDIRSAFEEIEARESGGQGEGAAADGDAGAPAAGAADDAAEASGRRRAADGRFAPKDDQPAGDPAAKATAPAEASTEEPPASWRADAKTKWGEIPAEVRTEIAKREREIARTVSMYGEERKFGREMADVIRPFEPEIKAAGVSAQQAIGVLMNNHKVLQKGTPEQKVALARRMIGEYGLDPRQLIDPNAPTDPNVIALQREIQQLRGHIARPQPADHAPLPPQTIDANVGSDIEAFRADPAHPHFEQVAPMMATLIETGQAADLTQAYDQAVWANPTLRSTLQAQQPSPAPQPNNEAQRQSPAKAAAARHAGASVARSPGPSGSPAPTSMREELRSNLRKSGWPA